MKPCPKCKKMNSAYADTCKYCGYDVKWVPDDGTDYKEPPNISTDELEVYDNTTNEKELEINPEKFDLDDIYNQLEDIKGQLSIGSKLVDVNIPFSRMVMVFIKVILASIPAVIIVCFLFAIFWALFGGIFFNVLFKGYGIQ